MTPGSLPTASTEIYQEGLRLPPVKLYKQGAIDQEILAIILSNIRIADQLKMIWLEKGGGGNSHEGYHLPWYFAAQHTQIDCFEKRGRKGYLFTVGDEEPPEELLARHAKAIFGDSLQRDTSMGSISNTGRDRQAIQNRFRAVSTA